MCFEKFKQAALSLAAVSAAVVSFSGCAHRTASSDDPHIWQPMEYTIKRGAMIRTSIQDDDLLLPPGGSLKPVKDLTLDQIRDDVAILLYALDKAYVGRVHLEEDAFQAARERINSLGVEPGSDHSTEEVCEAIDKTLRLLPDSHLLAWIPGKGACRPTTRQRVFVPEFAGPSLSQLKRGESPWRQSFQKAGKHEIPVITIREFLPRDDGRWKGFIESATRVWGAAKAMVIDLRGASGDDAAIGKDLASALFDREVTLPAHMIYRSQTPAMFALLANSTRYRYSQSQSMGQDPGTLLSKAGAYVRSYELAKSGDISAEEKEEVAGPAVPLAESGDGRGKPLYILIDRGCALACETALFYLEDYPGARTFGTPTAGGVHFSRMGQVFLPNSHVAVQIASEYLAYKDGRNVEKLGIQPVIHVSANKDALEFALDDLEGLLNLGRKKQRR